MLKRNEKPLYLQYTTWIPGHYIPQALKMLSVKMVSNEIVTLFLHAYFTPLLSVNLVVGSLFILVLMQSFKEVQTQK